MVKETDFLLESLELELHQILKYWTSQTIDIKNGGFVGERDHFNKIVKNASKGIILNSRILWSFSAATNYYKSATYIPFCERSFNYLKDFFNDANFGGVYWELDSKGNPINKRKQVYAQTFMMYALSEYYQFSKNKEALDWAIELFQLIEKFAFDVTYNGYIEAFNEDWSPIEDMRLSDKDANEAKTMNTHLHILEAYTNLYKVYKNEGLKQHLSNLINLFFDKFLKPNNHFQLFFDEQWNAKGTIISYGHDIETAWLLIEAAKVINDQHLITKTERLALNIADTFMNEGIDADGGVFYEFHPETDVLDTDKHWWPQAEAMVGLVYAYKISKDEKYLIQATKIMLFIQKYCVDINNGEWFWKVNKNGIPDTQQYKMGMWKAPYHTSRACMVLLQLLQNK